nr:heat shock protein 26-like [Aedes albopictus]
MQTTPFFTPKRPRASPGDVRPGGSKKHKDAPVTGAHPPAENVVAAGSHTSWNYRRFPSTIVHYFGSTIHADKVKFQINLDVQQLRYFGEGLRPSLRHSIIIEGDTSRSRTIMATYNSQYFIQRYSLTPELDFNQINSSISSHGILTISAPKRAVADAEGHKSIPIVQTGQPLKRISVDHVKKDSITHKS